MVFKSTAPQRAASVFIKDQKNSFIMYGINIRILFNSVHLLAFFFCLVFTGCINYEQTTTLDTDGSGEMEIHYWTKESVVNWLSGDKFVFNEAEVNSRYSSVDVEVEKAVVETDATDSTRHVRIKLRFDDINKLSDIKAFSGVRFSFLREGNRITFSQEMKGNSSANGLGLENFAVSYKYHMPGEIISTNATNVEGRTLLWKYKLPELSNDVVMTATLSISAIDIEFILTLLIVGTILGIILLSYFLVRRSIEKEKLLRQVT